MGFGGRFPPGDAWGGLRVARTDENGWTAQYLPSGKRYWTRFFGPITATAALVQTAVNTTLPVGVASHATVYAWAEVRGHGNGHHLRANVQATDATTIFFVTVAATNGVNVSAVDPTYDVIGWVEER